MYSSHLCSHESETLTRKFLDTWSYGLSISNKTFENECLQLIELLDQTRIKWKNSEVEKKVYLKKYQEIESLYKTSDERMNQLKRELIDREAEINALKTKNEEIYKELEEYRLKWDHIREKLNDPSREIEYIKYISNNTPQATVTPVKNETINITPRRRLLSPIKNDEEGDDDAISTADYTNTSNSDIDYDRTGESFDLSPDSVNVRRVSRKRRSRSALKQNCSIKFDQDAMLRSCPSKRSKNEEQIVATATITVDPTGVRQPRGSLTVNRMRNRSMSESRLDEVGNTGYGKIQQISTTPITSGIHSPLSIESSWTNGQPIEKRTHRMTAFWPLLESCDVCNKRFGLTGSDALKCLDCCIRFHRSCHKSAPMPCVPQVKVPAPVKNQKLPLKSYCPRRHPMIPPLMIHCIVALEEHRLTREGIYRIPGSEVSVKKLYNEFMTARVVPNLSNIDTETITGVIKRFLRELKDALVPPTSFEEFKSAVESNSDEQLEQAILDLPNPNRDTLAFFLQHLQNVSKYSTENMMPIENIARVLAPTIVGYSSFVTTTYADQGVIVKNQYAILYKLLKMPQEYWRKFVDKNMASVIYEERTPRLRNLTPQISRIHTRKLNKNRHIMESSPLIQPLDVNPKKGPIFDENLI